MPDVERGTVAVYADIACPWSHVIVHRLWEARRRLGLETAVRIDPRPFPLELVNRRPTPKPVLDAEIPVAGRLESEAGWRPWPGPEWSYPVTTLPALEAVQAAREQGAVAVERLDRALRRAFVAEGRCIAMRHVILEVAAGCGLDAGVLEEALGQGRARHLVRVPEGVTGSPHLFAGGDGVFNPGVRLHWDGPEGEGGVPVIDEDDVGAVEALLREAAVA